MSWGAGGMDPCAILIAIVMGLLLYLLVKLFLDRGIIFWRREEVKEVRESEFQGLRESVSLQAGIFTDEQGTNVVAIDCEPVVCYKGPDDTREVQVAAHCAIVDYNYQEIYCKYICPDLKVKNYKGLEENQEEVKKGVPLEEAKKEILNILEGKIVVVHDLEKDFGYLKIEKDAIPKSTRDTARYRLLCDKAGISHPPNPRDCTSLKDLAKEILKKNIHKKSVKHNPLVDAQVAMELYRVVEKEWEKEN